MIARIVGQLFTIRRTSLVVGAIIVGLAFPGGAMAAGGLAYTEHITTPGVMKNHGFKLSLRIFQGTPTGYGGRNPNTVVAILKRKNGHATQVNTYSFSRGIRFKGSKDLAYASGKGTLANRRGSINMTFHATGPASKASVPKGCGGTPGRKRPGVLKGSLKLKADKLGTVKLRSIKATLSSANYTCQKSVKGYLLETPGGRYYVAASKKKASGSVREEISLVKQGGGFLFTYTYSVAREPTSDYKLNTSNLSTATVKGAGGIGGKATYQGYKSHTQSYGKLQGTLWVKMAAIGAVRPFARAKNHTLSADQRR
jgi:hypothetical protein